MDVIQDNPRPFTFSWSLTFLRSNHLFLWHPLTILYCHVLLFHFLISFIVVISWLSSSFLPCSYVLILPSHDHIFAHYLLMILCPHITYACFRVLLIPCCPRLTDPSGLKKIIILLLSVIINFVCNHLASLLLLLSLFYLLKLFDRDRHYFESWWVQWSLRPWPSQKRRWPQNTVRSTEVNRSRYFQQANQGPSTGKL